MNRDFTEILLRWYARHKRDLPWRHEHDPYRIWVSEIILQQTRVVQGTGYYLRFLEKFPDIFSLAAASVEQVLKVWEGLGYYSRARNMHETARQIVRDKRGVFPDRYDDLIKLKGIGPYTAAAIASFAFGEAVPVVDGNVFRVLSRYFALKDPLDTADGKKRVTRLARRLMPAQQAGDFNQAVMEFGALQCVPAQPDCDICPLRNDCRARKQNLVEKLPVRSKSPGITSRYLHYLVWINNGMILVKQRNKKDIWHKLYDFPEIVTGRGDDPQKVFAVFLQKNELPGDMINNMRASGPVTHQLTHRKIHARFYHIHADTWPPDPEGEYLKVPLRDIRSLAFPRLITSYMENHPALFMP